MALHASQIAGGTIGPWVYNDFLQLLTGVMTDTAVTLKYQPASGTVAALTLYSKAGNPLMQGYKPDGTTQAFVMDENGNLTVTSISTGGGALAIASVTGSSGSLLVSSQQSGAASGVYFKSWSGSAAVTPFSVGGQFNSALSWVDNSGYFHGSIGTANGALSVSDDGTNVNIQNIGYSTFARTLRLFAWNGSAQNLGLAINTDGSLALGGKSIQSGSTFIGFKDSGGTKLAEFKAGGQLVVAAGNPSFVSTNSTAGYSTGGAFDSFDVSEAYETDGDYERGAVLCPGPDGRLTRCTHDKCRAALVVSTGGAVNIGGQFSEEDYAAHVKPMALVGRVLIDTDEHIPAFAADGQPTLVTANGRGGVRAMSAGESGFALGYALTATQNGKVGVVVSRMFCQA